jgi:uncharacterized protein (UPF0248 family)
MSTHNIFIDIKDIVIYQITDYIFIHWIIMNQLFKSDYPRDILNEIKWKKFDLGRCEIYYIHRGAPNNTKIISGSSIKTIGRSFFETRVGTSIPYHRIFRIDFDGARIYEKRIDL